MTSGNEAVNSLRRCEWAPMLGRFKKVQSCVVCGMRKERQPGSRGSYMRFIYQNGSCADSLDNSEPSCSGPPADWALGVSKVAGSVDPGAYDGMHDGTDADFEARNSDGRTLAERDALDRWARRNDDGAGLPDDDRDPDGDFLRETAPAYGTATMTRTQALAEARRRWGERGVAFGSQFSGGKVVGQETPVIGVYDFLGTGATYEAAFAAADALAARRGK